MRHFPWSRVTLPCLFLGSALLARGADAAETMAPWNLKGSN